MSDPDISFIDMARILYRIGNHMRLTISDIDSDENYALEDRQAWAAARNKLHEDTIRTCGLVCGCEDGSDAEIAFLSRVFALSQSEANEDAYLALMNEFDRRNQMTRQGFFDALSAVEARETEDRIKKFRGE